jgi:Flp pilus assembly protein CpaB
MIRRLIPISIAAAVFLGALFVIRPEATKAVVVAAGDIPAGRALQSSDLEVKEIPERLAPADAFDSSAPILGKTLMVDRGKGDVIRPSSLGEVVTLGPDERAVAVRVTDSGGLAGLIKPGDAVGIVASIDVQNPGAAPGTFTKAAIEPLKVMYISPDFRAVGETTPAADTVTGLIASQQRREQEGTVVLAVPTSAYVILYDFTSRKAANEARTVNALELLTALDAAGNAKLSLYLVPERAASFASSGLFLPDLVITPVPTATATATPEGYKTPTPTPTTTPTQKPTATMAP